jgi:hypothetical protein
VPVTIGEITSEVVLERTKPEAAGNEPARLPDDDQLVDRVVRRSVERVLELLRLEWER